MREEVGDFVYFVENLVSAVYITQNTCYMQLDVFHAHDLAMHTSSWENVHAVRYFENVLLLSRYSYLVVTNTQYPRQISDHKYIGKE